MWDLIVSVPDHCLSFYFLKDLISDFYLIKFRNYCIVYCTTIHQISGQSFRTSSI